MWFVTLSYTAIGISSTTSLYSITGLLNSVSCYTTTVNATTDVYWLVNGLMKYNSMYTFIDSNPLTYNNTLLVYPDPLGVSVNVTCIAMYKGVNYSETVILQGIYITISYIYYYITCRFIITLI